MKKRARKAEQIQQQIRKSLDVIRPILRIEDCALKLARFEMDSGTVVLEIQGGCADCEASVATFQPGIETQLKLRIPEIKEIRFITGAAAR
ncbi:MAG: NifU family protein [Gemmatimonadaceae bacterium]|nr:NifU family protein [Gemmatimonadaceae bacterium]